MSLDGISQYERAIPHDVKLARRQFLMSSEVVEHVALKVGNLNFNHRQFTFTIKPTPVVLFQASVYLSRSSKEILHKKYREKGIINPAPTPMDRLINVVLSSCRKQS